MEGSNEDMETDVIMQQADESIRMESDQFMEDQSEFDFEQVPNQEPLPIQETFIPTKQASNPLLTRTEPVQLVQTKPIEPFHLKHVYIFP